MGKGGTKPSFDSFLKAPKYASAKCETCDEGAETLGLIKKFVGAQDRKQTAQTVTAFHRFLVEHYEYPLSHYALRSHIANCVRGKHGRRQK